MPWKVKIQKDGKWSPVKRGALIDYGLPKLSFRGTSQPVSALCSKFLVGLVPKSLVELRAVSEKLDHPKYHILPRGGMKVLPIFLLLTHAIKPGIAGYQTKSKNCKPACERGSKCFNIVDTILNVPVCLKCEFPMPCR